MEKTGDRQDSANSHTPNGESCRCSRAEAGAWFPVGSAMPLPPNKKRSRTNGSALYIFLILSLSKDEPLRPSWFDKLTMRTFLETSGQNLPRRVHEGFH